MSELLPITIASIILAWLSQHVNTRPLTEDGHYKKDWIIYAVMAVCMILFVGLRKSYNDTSTYINSFTLTPIDAPIDWKLGSNPGYQLMIRALKALGFSAQSYLMFYAVVITGIYLWFLRKYSPNLWLSVFLLFTTGCYIFTMAAVKQCVAIAFSLLAVDRFLKKKYVPYVLFILIGMLFHPYSLMFLIMPLLDFRPWSTKTWIMLLIFFIVGLTLQQFLGTVVSVASMLGEDFDVESLSGEGVNPFRLAVVSIPLVMSFFTRSVIDSENDRELNLILNLSMLNAAIMFIGLFGTAIYFGRLANYFLIFQCVSLPWIINHFEVRSKRYITLAMIVGFSAFSYYENAISNGFDMNYSAITLTQYIKMLLKVS